MVNISVPTWIPFPQSIVSLTWTHIEKPSSCQAWPMCGGSFMVFHKHPFTLMTQTRLMPTNVSLMVYVWIMFGMFAWPRRKHFDDMGKCHTAETYIRAWTEQLSLRQTNSITHANTNSFGNCSGRTILMSNHLPSLFKVWLELGELTYLKCANLRAQTWLTGCLLNRWWHWAAWVETASTQRTKRGTSIDGSIHCLGSS